MGVGFGLMMLIGVAGDAMNAGIGVGGFFVIMGLAFFINGLVRQPPTTISLQPPAPEHRPDDSLETSPPRLRRVSRLDSHRHPYRYTRSRRYTSGERSVIARVNALPLAYGPN
jgi:hypothetical protein